MKHLLPFLLLLPALFQGADVHAQRIAFVNTKYILENMPEYQSAQQELNRWSAQWQAEIDERYEQIKRMRDAYNAEAILLTEEMKRSRLDEIQRREQEARELQKKRFGVEGDLFKKRQELIQPIQDRIYDAIKEVAGTSYVAIFDIGGQSNSILFASEKYDKSDSVLRKLGIRPGRGGGNDDGGRDDDGGDEEPDMGGRDTGGSDTQRQPPSRGGTDTVKPR
ncbi:MAG: OmpH family outer membrane protein [Flavobacteriales bacterium]|nr:OmpH family outer membrane protein [Flavobacteriales bacterium]MCB0785888.1 OmpH family outer membrane protein [Flavobacteriales bacterium]